MSTHPRYCWHAISVALVAVCLGGCTHGLMHAPPPAVMNPSSDGTFVEPRESVAEVYQRPPRYVPTTQTRPKPTHANPLRSDGEADRQDAEPLAHRVGADLAVIQASQDESVAEGWEDHLHETIAALETQEKETSPSDAEPNRQVFLRILYAIAGRREDARRPIAGLGEVENEFWHHEIQGLAALLDAADTPDLQQRATTAAEFFRTAAAKAGELGVLKLGNLAFCTAIHSFGVIERFEKTAFTPGEELLLYAEVENFTSESTTEGYRTTLAGRYQILRDGDPLVERDLPAAEETCQHQRRDFFVSYRLRLPADLQPGDYTLQLTLEDTLGHKTATRSMAFRVKRTGSGHSVSGGTPARAAESSP